jgi:diguanylate cyclase (GGDEF)-like protein/PAS domain S-box-containing protein
MTDSGPVILPAVESSYESLYENAPCGLLTMTTDGVLVRVNDTFLEWTGYARAEVEGTPLRSLLAPGSQLFYETRYLAVLRLQGQAREVALDLLRVDGSVLPILVNSILGPSVDGATELVRAAVFDSTGRHDYERELLSARRVAETSETRVRVLQDASIAFGAAESEQALADAVVASARAAFAAASAALLLVDGQGVLRVVAGEHPFPPTGAESPVMANEQFYAFANLEEAHAFSPEYAEALRSARLEAASGAPLLGKSGTLGVLVCFFGRPREFDDHFVQLQSALARQAALVLGRIRLQRQLERAALHDQLTGLANRALLQERMDEALASTARSGNPLAVLFLDLDGFKQVNDHLGHTVGDSVLQEVAARLRSEVRGTDVVGRFGGDEFVVLCTDTDENLATLVTERIRRAIGQPLKNVPPELPVTASIGIAIYSGRSPLPADALFRIADDAMYRSKNAGKDCSTVVLV